VDRRHGMYGGVNVQLTVRSGREKLLERDWHFGDDVPCMLRQKLQAHSTPQGIRLPGDKNGEVVRLESISGERTPSLSF
jgi:hypothetical protein